MKLEHLTDEELIQEARRRSGPAIQECLDVLFRRHYPRVAYWCLRICGSREAAADLAQEVFLRVQSRLDSFRMESRFSTWLYQVTRSVAINHGEAARKRSAPLDGLDSAPELADPVPAADEILVTGQSVAELKEILEQDLEPLEAKVLYLHYGDGLTLPGITAMLGLQNKS
ncbi:MAG TPA: sigma-70 family RNA polymerase sigma factor, partial [Thermoanaerobaculia bacterium]|nr:sigma-70 family RNA polymerase sigma factor [Thermoanaerobaculia bacterium]